MNKQPVIDPLSSPMRRLEDDGVVFGLSGHAPQATWMFDRSRASGCKRRVPAPPDHEEMHQPRHKPLAISYQLAPVVRGSAHCADGVWTYTPPAPPVTARTVRPVHVACTSTPATSSAWGARDRSIDRDFHQRHLARVRWELMMQLRHGHGGMLTANAAEFLRLSRALDDLS